MNPEVATPVVNNVSTIRIVLSVALGGFLMGFDASVISGVVSAIESEFGLDKLQLGWAVASLTLTASLAMLASGPLAERFGRRPVLSAAAVIFAASAVFSALAQDFTTFVAARMLGGLGVGTALIIAPMLIAELVPAADRGRLVSFNQLNIVLGISAAYFSNYLLLALSQVDAAWVSALGIDRWAWRWMLGVEALPAVLYFLALRTVPESPRWLMMKGREAAALAALRIFQALDDAREELAAIAASLRSDMTRRKGTLGALFGAGFRRVLIIALIIAVLQQATGINAVFFYAPMIFAQSGAGVDASFLQAVLVGLTNLVFTVVALLLIDRVGRRPLLIAGLAGIAVCMASLSLGFGAATYQLTAQAMVELPAEVAAALAPLVDQVFTSDTAFRAAVIETLGAEGWTSNQAVLVGAAIEINSRLILLGLLGFVASFAVSLGPVMWVLFSELFPNRIRAIAVSFVGLINSGVSFMVQLVFPWELQQFGAATTFGIYALMALVGWGLVVALFPETRGKRLEALEAELVGAD